MGEGTEGVYDSLWQQSDSEGTSLLPGFFVMSVNEEFNFMMEGSWNLFLWNEHKMKLLSLLGETIQFFYWRVLFWEQSSYKKKNQAAFLTLWTFCIREKAKTT